MGFFDYMASESMKMVKSNYKSMTGRNYDSDFNNFMMDYSYKDDYEVKNRWRELSDNRGVRFAAEKEAVRQTLLERGIDPDDL